MNITFENTALAELYHNGTTQERRYKRLTQDIIKRYIKVVNFLRAARRLEDLFLIKSLHYEKKRATSKEWMWYGSTISTVCSFIAPLMKVE